MNGSNHFIYAMKRIQWKTIGGRKNKEKNGLTLHGKWSVIKKKKKLFVAIFEVFASRLSNIIGASLAWKALWSRYFWSTMKKDTQSIIRSRN